ncbi:putative GH25 family protein [Sphingomonas vulcanisoli]|uniref:GH25 family protein n=1 Tax=Sphingomonas vulcanisoli TaxID=1658060 RepID=A0ABX0TTG3_9SPHN|nr:DUF4198 domain-containing protein [Sphingomonas vulcanisoli]NIJ07060.1 putative GH25 family protein [Sphingomonas vulcanisoli]
MKLKILLALSIATLAASSALADHAFLMPSFSNFSGVQSVVQIDAAQADNIFQFDHRPIQLDQIKVYRPDGSEAEKPQGSTSRFRSTFDLKLDAPGTWKIAALNVMVSGTAVIGGEERRVSSMRFGRRPGGPGGPAMQRPDGPPRAPGAPGEPRRQPPILLADLPADATDLKLTEIVGRTEVFVTVNAPTTQVFGGDPRGITLQPITHPTDLVSNEPAKFKFLIDGQPAAKLKVTLIAGGQRFRDSEAGIDFTTDAQGVVTIKWPAPGYYLLTASAEDNKAAEKRATVRRLSYGATLEVAAP